MLRSASRAYTSSAVLPSGWTTTRNRPVPACESVLGVARVPRIITSPAVSSSNQDWASGFDSDTNAVNLKSAIRTTKGHSSRGLRVDLSPQSTCSVTVPSRSHLSCAKGGAFGSLPPDGGVRAPPCPLFARPRQVLWQEIS